MHRLIVALLATVDAAIAAAVGLAATLAPLTLLWVVGFGGDAEWGVLWPAAATVWQFGNLVPLLITLPPEYLAATGIDSAAASFVLSLAPLAFAAFTVIFAARSGVRASRADAWVTGVVTSSLAFAAIVTAVALTADNPIALVERWQAILVPALLFAVPALVAALVTEWSEAGVGAVARVRDRAERLPHHWGDVPALAARGGAVVVVGLVGAGAAVAAVALFARAGQMVALFQAGDADVLGATVITLAQLAYVPTLVVWGLSFVAGPGFAVGEGTAVSPAGTQVGVVPGLPALGAVPESTTSWLLLLALVPVALGALAGWIARSRLVRAGTGRGRSGRMPRPAPGESPASSRFDAGKTAALSGLLAGSASGGSADAEPRDASHSGSVTRHGRDDDPMAARLVITLAIAVIAGGAAGLLSLAASGSLGPGRLADFGPQPGPVALAVGLEVLVGAAILLLSPRGIRRGTARTEAEETEGGPETAAVAEGAEGAAGEAGGEASVGVESSSGANVYADVDAGPSPVRPSMGALGGLGGSAGWGGSRPAAGVPKSEPEATTEPIDLPPQD